MIKPIAWRTINTTNRWWLNVPDDEWDYSSHSFSNVNQEALFNINPNDYIALLELILEALTRKDKKLQQAMIIEIQNLLNRSIIKK